MKNRYMRFSEVLDSVNSLRQFIVMNDIKQEQIVDIIIVWDDKLRGFSKKRVEE